MRMTRRRAALRARGAASTEERRQTGFDIRVRVNGLLDASASGIRGLTRVVWAARTLKWATRVECIAQSG